MKITVTTLGGFTANCYLIEDSDQGAAALIDPGAGNSLLQKFIDSTSCTITHILLTHRHYDHILGVHTAKELTGAKVYIHEQDAPGLTDDTASLAAKHFMCQTPVQADVLLKDKDEFTVGGLAFRVLHTPGHTAGGVMYISGSDIFSGDTLFAENIGRTDLPTGSMEQMTDSLKKIKALSGDYNIYPGHGESTTLSYEKACNVYLR